MSGVEETTLRYTYRLRPGGTIVLTGVVTLVLLLAGKAAVAAATRRIRQREKVPTP